MITRKVFRRRRGAIAPLSALLAAFLLGMVAFAIGSVASVAAGISYLLPASLASALLFLLADQLRNMRGGSDHMSFICRGAPGFRLQAH